MTDLKAYRELYIKTAQEHLHMIANGLATLQHNQQDAGAIEDLILHYHSLKSASLVIGHTQIGEICRAIEQFFHNSRDSGRQPTADHLKAIHKSTKSIQHALTLLQTGEQIPDLLPELSTIKNSLQ